MDLTIGEKIVIFRQRKNKKINELAKVFTKTRRGGNDIKNAHIKLRKIETGAMMPTDEEIDALAEKLGVSPEELRTNDALSIPDELIAMYPKLQFYIETLVKAYKMKDKPMVEHLINRLGMA